MPEMSGTEATNYIRTFWPRERQPQIAAMTAYASEANRTWLLNIGMDDYICKPVRIEELVRVLQSATPGGLARPAASKRTSYAPEETLDSELFAAFLAGISENNPADDAIFVASYVADMDVQTQALRDALTSGNTERFTRIAHTLKGLCLQLGAMNIAILWRRIETCGERGDTASATKLLPRATTAYAALRQTLLEHPTGRVLADAQPEKGTR